MASGFWSETCPERGPFLNHVHIRDCVVLHREPAHLSDQCCLCMQRASNWIPHALGRGVAGPLGEPDLAVSSADRAAARRPWDAWAAAMRPAPPAAEDDPKEPKFASGLPGNGELSEREMRRLEFYVCFIRGFARRSTPRPWGDATDFGLRRRLV